LLNNYQSENILKKKTAERNETHFMPSMLIIKQKGLNVTELLCCSHISDLVYFMCGCNTIRKHNRQGQKEEKLTGDST
jgi:hypothetical protein